METILTKLIDRIVEIQNTNLIQNSKIIVEEITLCQEDFLELSRYKLTDYPEFDKIHIIESDTTNYPIIYKLRQCSNDEHLYYSTYK